jgi:hypothetical protein
MGTMILDGFQNSTGRLVKVPSIINLLPLLTQLSLLTCLVLETTR